MKTYLSTDTLNSDFNTDWYQSWVDRLSIRNNRHHAKFWEQAMLYQALKRNGMLQPGKRGLGFGVGEEQLVSVFASEGPDIVATDQAPEGAALKWGNGQLTASKDSLFYEHLIDHRVFDRRVTFQHHDMNSFNRAWVDKFDFVWSNCVIGHLGSIKLSQKHLLRHAKYIKYGGISVLTTELNISSLSETVSDNSGTIIWRLSDLEQLFRNMLDSDMVAHRLKLRLTKDDSDKYLWFTRDEHLPGDVLHDKPFNKLDPFITKVPFSNYAITQIQIVFEKRHLTPVQKSYYRKLYHANYLLNTHRLRRFINSGEGDIVDYSTTYTTTDLDVVPASRTKRIKARPGELLQVSVSYRNNSSQSFFSYGSLTPLHVPPLVLATASPLNRSSELQASDWFSDNRPAVTFFPIYSATAFARRSHGKHRVLPGERCSYTFTIKVPEKHGTYTEDFCLVLEGLGDIPKSLFTLKLTVA